MPSTRILALLALTGCISDGFVDYYGDDGDAPSVSSITPTTARRKSPESSGSQSFSADPHERQ